MALAVKERSAVVGKKELCAHLNWSRPTLDRRLAQDPNFPVMLRGDQGGPWAFDVATVESYLTAGTLSKTPPAPTAKVEHVGEATARQRRDHAQAALFEDKLARERGALVEADKMRMAVSTMLAALGESLTALPDKIVRDLNLPEMAAPRIRAMIDAMRRTAVDDLRTLLSDE